MTIAHLSGAKSSACCPTDGCAETEIGRRDSLLSVAGLRFDMGTYRSSDGLFIAARRIAWSAFCLVPLAAVAQGIPGEVEKALLQRQQYQDELALRQRQFQEQLNPALGSGQRQELERRHFDQQQRQRELHEGQLKRHLELQQILPQLPEDRQRLELQREGAEFARERAEQLDRRDR